MRHCWKTSKELSPLTVENVAVRLRVVLDAGVQHFDLLFDVVKEAVAQVDAAIFSLPSPLFPLK